MWHRWEFRITINPIGGSSISNLLVSKTKESSSSNFKSAKDRIRTMIEYSGQIVSSTALSNAPGGSPICSGSVEGNFLDTSPRSPHARRRHMRDPAEQCALQLLFTVPLLWAVSEAPRLPPSTGNPRGKLEGTSVVFLKRCQLWQGLLVGP